MKREIEIWFTALQGRESRDAEDMRQAKKICRELSQKGFDGITVDVTFWTEENGEKKDFIEEKSKWYSFDNGKLKAI